MAFKDSNAQFQIVDTTLLAPDAAHVRRQIDDASLKSLANSIRRMGVIQPLVVQPADANGRHTVIVGERRRRAALLAGEQTVPVVIRRCLPDETLEVQVFENIGLGVRAPLEARDMAKALQSVAKRFESPEEAAQYFDRPPTWLNQATAPANLSEKVSALLEAGKISSTGAAVQLEKLAQKDEAKGEALIAQIARLPEGEKVSKKRVDHALAEVSGRRKATPAPSAEASPDASNSPPWEEATPRSRVNPGKVKLVAEILGISDEDEAQILERVIDEFLALRRG